MPATLPLDGVAIGDSIAIAGACMTVVAMDGRPRSTFDVSRESLDHTAGLDVAGDVNLEKALRFGDRLDGHLVSGHVDGTGIVVRFDRAGESWTLLVRAPLTLARFIALKGSIAVDGVSLTINAVDDHDRRLRLLDQPDPAHGRRHDAASTCRSATASTSRSTRSRATSSGCCGRRGGRAGRAGRACGRLTTAPLRLSTHESSGSGSFEGACLRRSEFRPRPPVPSVNRGPCD